jgi:hypothetical protein
MDAADRQPRPARSPILTLAIERAARDGTIMTGYASATEGPRTTYGMSGLRREALRHIPGLAGKDWRDVLGSDGLPDAERLRGKIACQETGGRVQVSGAVRRGPARYGES